MASYVGMDAGLFTDPTRSHHCIRVDRAESSLGKLHLEHAVGGLSPFFARYAPLLVEKCKLGLLHHQTVHEASVTTRRLTHLRCTVRDRHAQGVRAFALLTKRWSQHPARYHGDGD